MSNSIKSHLCRNKLVFLRANVINDMLDLPALTAALVNDEFEVSILTPSDLQTSLCLLVLDLSSLLLETQTCYVSLKYDS